MKQCWQGTIRYGYSLKNWWLRFLFHKLTYFVSKLLSPLFFFSWLSARLSRSFLQVCPPKLERGNNKKKKKSKVTSLCLKSSMIKVEILKFKLWLHLNGYWPSSLLSQTNVQMSNRSKVSHQWQTPANIVKMAGRRTPPTWHSASQPCLTRGQIMMPWADLADK